MLKQLSQDLAVSRSAWLVSALLLTSAAAGLAQESPTKPTHLLAPHPAASIEPT